MKPCDVLFLGPHPDDIEIACGGTVLRCVAAGLKVGLLDATRGEKGSLGTVADRDAEAAAAAARLGVAERANLGLPDTAVQVDEMTVHRLVAVLRAARPGLLFAPLARDVHPDHVAVGQLAERAAFLAGLRHYAPAAGAAHRPRLLVRYPGNRPVEPTFVVDIAELQEAKAEVLRCYRSQLQPKDRRLLVQGLDVLERAQVRDRFYGAQVGAAAAEPYWLDGPLPLREVLPLMPSST